MSTDPWTIGGEITSAVVAFFTGWLALSTRKLSIETAELSREQVQASRLADRHHQEMNAPHLIVHNLEIRTNRCRKDNEFWENDLEITGVLENIGHGIASDIELELEFEGYEQIKKQVLKTALASNRPSDNEGVQNGHTCLKHDRSLKFPEKCQDRIYDHWGRVSVKASTDPIMTRFSSVVDVKMKYTPE